MASVSSLDQDMRNLRLSRYTPQAANEVRAWIEDTLGDRIPSGDLLDALKDGVALCRLANLALPPPGIKFKASSMPFIQMENISHFLRACEMPPLNLPAHDRFLTVDLYESKDPAQVLQCLTSFSRKAHAAAPDRFPTTIGPAKKTAGVISPTNTGGMNGTGSFRGSNSIYGGRARSPTKPSAAMPSSTRPMSPALTGGSTGSQTSNTTKSPSAVSSWSSRKDETVTSPAWNIHQYGYMGGASQGNQGISFGARRQITSQAPSVPGLAEKERKRKEKAMEEERARELAEEEEQRRRADKLAEEERARLEEERKWEAETTRLREEERSRVEEQKRLWGEQERRWLVEEEARRKDAAEMQASLVPKKQPPERPRNASGSVLLRGQTLSQYQRDQQAAAAPPTEDLTPEQRRVRELEKQLEEARERERVYQAEREERLRNGTDRSRPSTATTQTETEVPRPQSARESEASWAATDEREFLRGQWQNSRNGTPIKPAAAAVPATTSAPQPPKSSPSATQAGAAEPFHRRPVPTQQPPQEPQPRLPSRPLPQPHASGQEEEAEEEDEADELPSLPHHQPQEPTHRPEEQDEEDEDDFAPSLPSRPSQPQTLQQSISSSSIPRFNPESAPSSSPLGSANRPIPSSDPRYEPYSPTSTKTGQQQARQMGGPRAFAPPPKPLRFGSREQPQPPPPSQQQQQQQQAPQQAPPQNKPKASQSLLEREMERERARQREWEADQQNLPPAAAKDGQQQPQQGPGWDVNQYGYTGGDNMNRGSSSGSGVNMGGRRQILGPRAMK